MTPSSSFVVCRSSSSSSSWGCRAFFGPARPALLTTSQLLRLVLPNTSKVLGPSTRSPRVLRFMHPAASYLACNFQPPIRSLLLATIAATPLSDFYAFIACLLPFKDAVNSSQSHTARLKQSSYTHLHASTPNVGRDTSYKTI